MKWYLLFAAIWTYCFCLIPLAYYLGYGFMAAIDRGPTYFAVWLHSRRVIQEAVAFQEEWAMVVQRRPA